MQYPFLQVFIYQNTTLPIHNSNCESCKSPLISHTQHWLHIWVFQKVILKTFLEHQHKINLKEAHT